MLPPAPRGELIAGGHFIASGTTPLYRIARWNGLEWGALGTGVGDGTTWELPTVYALAVFRGDLVAGGAFTRAGAYVSACWARWGCPYSEGDLNCDGWIDAFDIDPFVLALTDPTGYDAKYPACDVDLADINADGQVDAFDIDPFVDLLTGG